MQRGGERHTGRIRTATTQCGDVTLSIDALETGDNHHDAIVQIAANVGFLDLQNARLGKCAVGQDAHLAAGIATRLDADVLQCHRQQRDADLLAGRQHGIQFARIGLRRYILANATRRLVSPLIAETTTTS